MIGVDFKAGGGGFLVLLGVTVAASIALGLAMRSSSTGARRFQEGKVTGISGRKGHGKTLFSVHELRRHVGTLVYCRECTEVYNGTDVQGREWETYRPEQECAIRRGRIYHRGHIASNGSLNLSPSMARYRLGVGGWDDLFTLPHGTLVVIDEAHLWAPAVAGRELPERVRWFLSQCRKLHVELIWVSQHEDRVALGLRRQTDEIGVCVKGYFKAMRVKFYEPEDVRKRDAKAVWVFRYRVNRTLAASYNTYELLMPEASESDREQSADARVVEARRLKSAGRADHAAPAAGTPSASPDPDSVATAT